MMMIIIIVVVIFIMMVGQLKLAAVLYGEPFAGAFRKKEGTLAIAQNIQRKHKTVLMALQ